VLAKRRVAPGVLGTRVDHLDVVEVEFAGEGFEEFAATALSLDQGDVERGVRDGDRDAREAAAGADIGDVRGLALGGQVCCTEGDEQGERFAEEAPGDGGGFGDRGETGSFVPIEEQLVVAGKGVELLVGEREVEPEGLFGECGQQLAGVRGGSGIGGGQGAPPVCCVDRVRRRSSRLLGQIVTSVMRRGCAAQSDDAHHNWRRDERTARWRSLSLQTRH